MIKYLFYIFHIVIISFFIGCGYKADPKWTVNKPDINQSMEYNNTKICK